MRVQSITTLVAFLASWTLALSAASAEVAPPASDSSNVVNDALKLRDPFKRPIIESAQAIPRTELELFAVEQYKMVGVVTGPTKMRAMVVAPNGKTYFVSENMKMGTRKGLVRKITPDGIQVRERIVNVLGKEENVDAEIRLGAEGARTAAPIGSSGG